MPDDDAVGPRTELTNDEVCFFDTFGFIVLRQHLAADQMDTIEAELAHATNLTYADSPFDTSVDSSEQLQGVNLSKASTPFIYSLPERPNFLGIATQLFGEDVIGHESSANLYVGDTRWHADRSGTDVQIHRFGCKFAMYPESIDGETGGLRVIPGSHLPSYYEKLRKMPGISDPVNIRNYPGLVCCSDPGDVILFNLNCWHASCGGRPGRALLDVAYYASPQTRQHEKEIRFQYTRNRQMSIEVALSNNQEPPTPTPEELLGQGDSALRTRWLVERPREFGYFDFDNDAYVGELQSLQNEL